MKILHIITSLDDGGAEAVLYRLCVYDVGHQHVVVSLMDEGKYGPLLRQKGITVHCLGMKPGRLSFKGCVKLWELLRRELPVVVQTWMYHADLVGGVISRLAGVRNVCWGIHHSNLVAGKSKKSTIYLSRLCGIISTIVARKIVSCAYRAADVHAKLGYAKNKMEIIPNGYDLSQFQPDIGARQRLRTEWGITDPIPVLGVVGRFNPQKNHKNLIDALAMLKKSGQDFCCALVGQGMSADNYELTSWIRNHNLDNQFLLLGQRDDVPSVMNALDVHVLSSFSEAFPNVLAEAMACGTPCVTTDVGDAALIVGETGWVVPPMNSMALSVAIEKSVTELKNFILWQQRRELCRNRIVSNFSIEKMVQSYHGVWGINSSA